MLVGDGDQAFNLSIKAEIGMGLPTKLSAIFC